jgi:hypothetical protein
MKNMVEGCNLRIDQAEWWMFGFKDRSYERILLEENTEKDWRKLTEFMEQHQKSKDMSHWHSRGGRKRQRGRKLI